jgi:hypothetical protein
VHGILLGFRSAAGGVTHKKDFGGARKELNMLWTVFVILLILWLLGLMTSHTMGGFIHILLVIAIVVVLVRVIQGRKPM